MHFALPPRKTSHPPPYARTAAKHPSAARRRQLQLLGYVVLGALTIYLLFSYLSSSASAALQDDYIEKDPEVVVMTIFDEDIMTDSHVQIVRANREDYAQRHGYKNFYTNITTYAHLVEGSPSSWTIVPALRHALKRHPTCNFVWALSAHALITNPSLSLSEHIFQPLDSLMLKDVPVVPPDSVIHTFSHIKPSHAHLILSQDKDNLAHTSLILRNTPPSKHSTDNWAHYLLDAWFDPLYRAYAFQKAENHALEHLVQWHPTILAKLVLIDQRLMNSYNHAAVTTTPDSLADGGAAAAHPQSQDTRWQEGDLVVNFKGCEGSRERDCDKEMKKYFRKWEEAVEKLDGKKPTYSVAMDSPEGE